MSDILKIEELLEDAWKQRRFGNYKKARDLVEQAEVVIKADDYDSLGQVFHIYAQFEYDHDQPEKALKLYRRSLEHYKKAGNSDKIAHSTRHIADLERKLGNDAESEQDYREAIGIYRSNPQTNTGDLANALAGFALILEKRGKIPQAITAMEETKELYEACGIQTGVDQAQRKLDSLRP